MVSKGFFPGWEEANEAWPGGCQSWVSTTFSKRAARRLITGTTSSPFGTASAPPGQKSFCTSTTIRQGVMSTVGHRKPARERAFRQNDHLAGIRVHSGERSNRRAMGDEDQVSFAGVLGDQ